MNESRTPFGTAHGTRSATRTEPASEAEADRRTTSSRTDAQTPRRATEESITSRVRRTPQAVALARLIADIRPDWTIDEIYTWALRDERPWADVIAAGINGARDRSIRQVGGLQYAGPAAPSPAITYPTVTEALNPQLCEHEFRLGACPFCRGGAAA